VFGGISVCRRRGTDDFILPLSCLDQLCDGGALSVGLCHFILGDRQTDSCDVLMMSAVVHGALVSIAQM